MRTLNSRSRYRYIRPRSNPSTVIYICVFVVAVMIGLLFVFLYEKPQQKQPNIVTQQNLQERQDSEHAQEETTQLLSEKKREPTPEELEEIKSAQDKLSHAYEIIKKYWKSDLKAVNQTEKEKILKEVEFAKSEIDSALIIIDKISDSTGQQYLEGNENSLYIRKYREIKNTLAVDK